MSGRFFRRAAVAVKPGWQYGRRADYEARPWRQHGNNAERASGSTRCSPPSRTGWAALSFEVAGIYFDWSKTHLDAGLRRRVRRARASEWVLPRRARRCLPARSSIRARAAPPTHVAERGSGAPDEVDLATARRQRMRALVDAIEAGAFGDVTGILHIGIGGSVLGPGAAGRRARPAAARGSTSASCRTSTARRSTRRSSTLDPATTLVVVASKTFTTLETLANMDAALRWLRGGRRRRSGRAADRGHRQPRSGGRGGHRRNPHPAVRRGGRRALFAVELGRRVAPRWRWAGTRSRNCSKARPRWTAISASPSRRENVAADRRFRRPALCRASSAARRARVFAYDERLRLLPSYLQQLEMESNGKSVTADGKPVEQPTAPVTWGGTGTDAQHAVFQLLHQGTVLVRSSSSRCARARTARTPSTTACCCSTRSRKARR